MGSDQKNKAARERYHWYLSHGICPICKVEDLQDGKKRCWRCRVKDNERMQARRAAESKAQADLRREKFKLKSKEARDKRKAEGICITCGKRKAENGKTRCGICLAYHRQKQLDQNRKNGMMPLELRGYGYCTICYAPTENKVCEECHARLVEHAAMMREKQSLKHHTWQKYNKSDVKRIEYAQTNRESR